MANRDKGGGARKYDRNRKWCEAYRNSGRRERNKALKLLRYFRTNGLTDANAVGVYNALPATAKPANQKQLIVAAKTAHKRIPPRIPMNDKQRRAAGLTLAKAAE